MMMTLAFHVAQVSAVLQEISDVEFQRRIWIEGKDPKVFSSFEEATCQLYDDFDSEGLIERLSVNEKWRGAAISLKAFLEFFDLFIDALPERFVVKEKLLTDEKWLEVVSAAKPVAKQLQELNIKGP